MTTALEIAQLINLARRCREVKGVHGVALVDVGMLGDIAYALDWCSRRLNDAADDPGPLASTF